MADTISKKLHLCACVLRDRLQRGNGDEIRSARDKMRAEMVAHYLSGYWKDKPEKLRGYMDLLYRSEKLLVTLGPVLAMRSRPGLINA